MKLIILDELVLFFKACFLPVVVVVVVVVVSTLGLWVVLIGFLFGFLLTFLNFIFLGILNSSLFQSGISLNGATKIKICYIIYLIFSHIFHIATFRAQSFTSLMEVSSFGRCLNGRFP